MNDQRHEAGLEEQFFLEHQGDGSKTVVDETMKVGRGSDCDLVLTCGKSSRIHAELSVADGELWVQDQDSTNGTFVNNRQIDEKTRLEDGDVVQFGDSRFSVVAPAKPEPEADDDKTVVASRESLLRMLDEEEKAASEKSEARSDAKPSEEQESKSAESGQESRGTQEAQEAQEADKADSPPEKKEPSASEKSAPSDESPADVGDGKATVDGAPAKAAGSEKDEKPPEPKKQAARPSGSKGGSNPSIPRSWADADRLEQASHTKVFVRGSEETNDSGSGKLHPLKAIAQARLNTPADLAILVGLTEPVRGTLFELDREGGKKKWEIGRGEDVDINIDDTSVSGRHAQLIHEKGRWKIVNMMSVNGTFVNGRKVLSAYLKARDVIRAGGVELVFDARIKKSRASSREQQASARRGGLLSGLSQWMGRQWARLFKRSGG